MHSRGELAVEMNMKNENEEVAVDADAVDMLHMLCIFNVSRHSFVAVPVYYGNLFVVSAQFFPSSVILIQHSWHAQWFMYQKIMKICSSRDETKLNFYKTFCFCVYYNTFVVLISSI